MKRTLLRLLLLLGVIGGVWLLLEATRPTPPTLVIGEASDAASLSPLTAISNYDSQIMSLLFVPLTETEPDFSRRPALAKSWGFSEDRRELTFYLRQDVFWHDGVQTTAHDVKFTHDLHVHPDFGFHSRQWKRDIEECIVIDDFTVKFVFSRVYPYQVMDASVGAPVPKHLLEKIPPKEIRTASFNQRPVGNGAYRLGTWRPDEFLEVIANEDYYDGPPAVKRIIFKVLPDPMNRVLQLERGDVDLVIRVPPQYYEELASEPHLVPHVLPDRVYYAIAWNPAHPPFDSKKVRQALTMAIPREELLEKIFGNHAQLCNGPISPIMWAFNPDVKSFPFDPEEAKRRLKEEGWADSDGDGILDKDGEKFTFELIANRGNTIKEKTNTIVQDRLSDVGIEVETRLLEDAEYKQRVIGKTFEAACVAWGVGLKMDLTTFWHSKSAADPYNIVEFQNEEFDRLNDQALEELDREKAKRLWWKAQDIIVEEQPYTFLYFPDQINFVNRRVRNVRMEAIGWNYNIEKWELAEEP